MRLFLDITRIAYRLTGTTPTGIDRVEFAYAERILRDSALSDTVCVFTTPFFTGALRREMMLDLLDRIRAAWRLDARAADDAIYTALRTYLARPIGGQDVERRFCAPSRLRHLRENMIFPFRDIYRSPTRLRRWLARSASEPVVYLNTSHNELETPRRLAWLRRPGTRCVFFIHDTIPIDYPEFVAPSGLARHMRRLDTVSRTADLVIVNSRTTAGHIEQHLTASGLRAPPVHVIPLAVADTFLRLSAARQGAPSAPADGHPYCVTLSTIEPRKNLLFLFSVWRRLVERLGPAAPRLVVVGQRGWENENIADILERSRHLGPYLVEVSDLCDDALAHLLSGARGLLQPSSIEGFGLPLIEGLTLGLPVIASNIAAHREAGGELVQYIDPIDGPAWLAAIEALAAPDGMYAAQRRALAASYRPLTWPDHVDAAMAVLSGLAPA